VPAFKLLKDYNFDSADSILAELASPSSQLFDMFANPPIPIVYTRFTGVDLVYVTPSTTFQFESRPEALFIEVFLHLPPSSGVRETLFADDREIHPRTFAEGSRRWFPLQRARLNPRTDPPTTRSCFVIVPVIKKSIGDVIREATKSPLPPEDVVARMPRCSCMGFSLAQVVEQVQAAGDAKCPTCGEQIVLAQVETDIRPKADEEETREMKVAKEKFFEIFSGMIAMPAVDGGWEEVLFGNAPPDDDGEGGDLEYHSTEEYLELMRRLT
jgi:hypothetical protein